MHKIESLIPQPSEVTHLGGILSLLPNACIVADPALASEAKYLAETLRKSTGYAWDVLKPTDETSAPRIILAIDSSKKSSPEAYQLETVANDLFITALSSAGIFYGIQTLLQLLPPAVYGQGPRIDVAWSIPRVTIRDEPRFRWRGVMLDCVRYFMPVPFLKKFIDLLALHKLNTFHWHLTDDQGWRIEIKQFPKLTEVGAWRSESQIGHYDAQAGGDGVRHGGFYTQEEIRDLVRYSAARHVTIVPEIEMPGHCQAILAAHPEMGLGTIFPVLTRWGCDPSAILKPSEDVFVFLKAILEEVAELFPGQYIHIGGDEAATAVWENEQEMQALMRELEIQTGTDLQAYFTKRVQGILHDLGRKMIGWDEIASGALDADAAVMAWRGFAPAAAAIAKGHDVVLSTMGYTYLNFYQAKDSFQEPLAIGNVLTLEKIYGFGDFLAQLTPEMEARVLGIQGQLWTEYMCTPGHVEYMAFPRLTALAEVAWSPPPLQSFSDFRYRLSCHLKRLDILGIRYRHS